MRRRTGLVLVLVCLVLDMKRRWLMFLVRKGTASSSEGFEQIDISNSGVCEDELNFDHHFYPSLQR